MKTEASTAMQVKMFVRHSLDGIEEEINVWLQQTKSVISYVVQSQCEKQGKFVFVISVFYNANDERATRAASCV